MKLTTKGKCEFYFRESRDGTVTAVLLERSTWDPQSITTYEKIGQHGSGCLAWLYCDTKPALEGNYSELLRELEGIYSDYEVIVKKKLPPMHKVLAAQIKEMRCPK